MLKKSFNELEVYSSDSYDRIPSNLKIEVVEIDENDENSGMKALKEIVSKNPQQKFIIFSNFFSRCMDIFSALLTLDIESSLITNNMSIEEKLEDLIKFPKTHRVLISMDVVSRGLDLEADHVVLYNLPTNPSWLISKIGRVGRNNSFGNVTFFLTKKDMELKNYLKPGYSWEDVFRFYRAKNKKPLKFKTILDFEIDEEE